MSVPGIGVVESCYWNWPVNSLSACKFTERVGFDKKMGWKMHKLRDFAQISVGSISVKKVIKPVIYLPFRSRFLCTFAASGWGLHNGQHRINKHCYLNVIIEYVYWKSKFPCWREKVISQRNERIGWRNPPGVVKQVKLPRRTRDRKSVV